MSHHLAQINIAQCRAPLDSPLMADFVALLDPINALAEATPGFIWRLKSAAGNATDIPAYPDPLLIVNLSVWTDLDALKAYVFRTHHVDAFRRRKEWFEEREEASTALWWIPAGHIPTVQEGKERLENLVKQGPTQTAFTFRQPFPAPTDFV